eukprot:GILJ01007162.1.p1 GENE.GILJ01007162.1~~GILJ01007162.1.p1  ORF type:complete len:465 (-),score=56.06 GILJ01007162.1:63-1457(-)
MMFKILLCAAVLYVAFASPVKVGIVGAGVGGTIAASTLRDILGQDVEIHIFDRSTVIGGRTRVMDFQGVTVELGASIVHEVNSLFLDAAEKCGLAKDSPSDYGKTAVWNGREVVIELGSGLIDTAKILWRYGWSPKTAQNVAWEAAVKYLALYNISQPWTTIEEGIHHTGLDEVTATTAAAYFAARKVGNRFIDEPLTGATRVNYGQSGHLINAVGAAVSLIPGNFYAIAGGNYRVPECLARLADATVHLQSTVDRISLLSNGSYLIESTSIDSQHHVITSQLIVIMATPMESARVEFVGIDVPESVTSKREYQTIFTTLVKGQVNPAYFRYKTVKDLPADFLTTEESVDIPFTSLSTLSLFEDGSKLYKLFSRSELSEELLNQIFSVRNQTEVTVWQAYPVLKPLQEGFPAIRIGSGMYYVNGFESVVSCMECSMLAARNVARLAAKDLQQARSSSTWQGPFA